jgi:hypothetical protein
MMLETEKKINELLNLLERIRNLVSEIELNANDLMVAKQLRLTRRDMENVLNDYVKVVHNGNDSMRDKFVYDMTGEVTLFDAPIDLWPKMAETAQNSILNKMVEER